MIKIFAIGGAPATGKSTLMKAFLAQLPPTKEFKQGTVRGLVCNEAKVVVLGFYPEGEGFGGTDRLAMNAQTDAKTFVRGANASPSWEGYWIVFEGDRLFNSSFLHHCQDNSGKLHIWMLQADATMLSVRHIARQDTQPASWLQGRETKIANIAKEFGVAIERHEHSYPQQTAELAAEMVKLVSP